MNALRCCSQEHNTSNDKCIAYIAFCMHRNIRIDRPVEPTILKKNSALLAQAIQNLFKIEKMFINMKFI